MALLAILLVPALVAVCCLVLSRRMAAILSVFGSAVVVLLTLFLVDDVLGGGGSIAVGGWLVCDPLSALILLLVAFVGLMAALFSIGYLHRREAAAGPAKDNYYLLYNLFLLSMLAVPILANIALVWIAIALTTLASAFLVAYEGTPEALEAAWKYVVLTTLGAVVALLGVVLLYWGIKLGGGGPFTWAALLATAPKAPHAVHSRPCRFRH